MLLAARPQYEREAYLRRRSREEAELVDRFLHELDRIAKSRIATNTTKTGTRSGIAAAVLNRTGVAVAAITLVGPTAEVEPRLNKLAKILTRHVDAWSVRSVTPREAI